MADCQHKWEMKNVQYGFVVFEKCFHCNELRTYFTLEDHPYLGEGYREEDHYWSRMEAAQSFHFNLRCTQCGREESYRELMGLLHCTGCLPECQVDIQRRAFEKEKTWLIVAFGYLPKAITEPVPDYKLDILSEYFNQRRDTARSRIKIVPFTLIDDLSRCKGDFMHDVGMLSQEPPEERKPVF